MNKRIISKGESTIYYRSDWPEAGWHKPVSKISTYPDETSVYLQQIRTGGAKIGWIVQQSELESTLYQLPIWELHVEVEDPAGAVLTAPFVATSGLQAAVDEGIQQLLAHPPWKTPAYVMSKVVKHEPLYQTLRQASFQEIEYRRLYYCQIQDIVAKASPFIGENITFTSLADVTPEELPVYQEQILGICWEGFHQKGYSRHFTDPLLLQRQPGIEYILAVMRLNFQTVASQLFLIAIDTQFEEVCGFTAIGKKIGLAGNRYSQLLSAVSRVHRGRGIYRGLTHLLSQKLPAEANLVNVTHTANLAIQRAYQNSGRLHLADTVVLRKFYAAPNG